MSNTDEPYDEDDNYEDDNKYYPDGGMHKHYFKFDNAAWDAWGKWLYDAMKDIVESDAHVWYTPTYIKGWPTKKFPVNYADSNTGKGNSFQYLGSNSYGEPIWKKKYFIRDELNDKYKKHIIANAKHFLTQPNYYKSLFDILN